MENAFLRLLIAILISLSPLLGGATNLPDKKTPNNDPVSTNVGEDPATDDRININVNRGHATAYGAGGGSVSDSMSRGVLVGIRRPGMADQTLYQKSDSYGTSHAYGQAPPRAWTGAQNQIANGVNRGGATAGFAPGSTGVAQTSSLSHTVEIPLDNYGTVMFSNLKEKPHGGAKEGKNHPEATQHHHKTLDMRPSE